MTVTDGWAGCPGPRSVLAVIGAVARRPTDPRAAQREDDEHDRHPGHELEHHAGDDVAPLDPLPRRRVDQPVVEEVPAEGREQPGPGEQRQPAVAAHPGADRHPERAEPEQPEDPEQHRRRRPVRAGLGGDVGSAVGARPADVHHGPHREVDERDAGREAGDREREQQDVAQPRVRARCVHRVLPRRPTPAAGRVYGAVRRAARARRGPGRTERDRGRLGAPVTPSLPRMFDTWTPAVLSLMNSSSAIWRLVRPSASSARTSRSRRVSGDGGATVVRRRRADGRRPSSTAIRAARRAR